MAEPKVARDAAELEVGLWEEAMEKPLPADDKEKVIGALMAGRITFDSSKESFAYRLRVPLELKNGERVVEVNVRDADVQSFADSFKGVTSASLDVLMRQLSVMSEVPLGVVGRIKSKDFNVLQALMGFFG
jgi:hypothetical protein